MKIGGLQPVTLLDYPSKVAATIFTSGCNMRCPFCHNPSLVLPEVIANSENFPEEKLFEFLNKRKKYLDGICITGGEPLLQPDIIDFCQKIKKLGYSIKFDTNGLMPQQLADLIKQQLIDYVAMDIKGPLEDYSKYAGVTVNSNDIQDSINIIKDSNLPHEFRSTLVKGLHQLEDILKMAELARGTSDYFLQNFTSSGPCVDPEFKGEAFTQAEMAEFQLQASKLIDNCHLRP